jgi:glycosyltransferase involved in cell wall biosynthesis
METDDRARVSVIIPVYNGERYLAETIESVLAQTYQPLEVIVVDDGSTDDSARVAQSFGPAVSYTYQQNLGTAAALNRGVELASGDYFAFLGADDLWTEDRAQLQMEAFTTHPEVDIVSGHVRQFISPELDDSVKGRIQFSPELIPGHVVPAMLIRREVYFRVGQFETSWVVGAEMSWYLRAKEMGLNLMILPDLVLLRRIHESNKGITKRQFITQRAQILKASLDRRRRIKTDDDEFSNHNDNKDSLKSGHNE